MKKYIQFKLNGNLETIDEMEVKTKEDRKQFSQLLKEYRTAFNVGYIYPSSKPCKNWRD